MTYKTGLLASEFERYTRFSFMVPGPFLNPVVAQAPASVQNQVRAPQDFAGGLKVTFDESAYDSESGDLTFTGRVTAVYDKTVLHCDSLTINEKTHTGHADSGVVLEDPEGGVKAGSLVFDWVEKTATLRDVVLQADNLHLEAKTLSVIGEKWELTGARGSLSRSGMAPVSFEARSATISPGRSGVLRHVYLRVYGAKIGPLSRLSFQLKRRLKGLGLPSVTNRKGIGVGVAWEANFAVGDHGVLTTFWDAFPRREPGFGLQYGYSPLSAESNTKIAPRSDLTERFEEGYFNNIGVRSLQDEQDDVRSDRLSYAVGSFWNQATTARPVDFNTVSKRFESNVEFGGVRSGFGLLGSARLQSIRKDGQSEFVERLVGQTTLLAPLSRLGPQLTSQSRFDLFGTVSGDGSYGWARLESGLVYSPAKELSLGAAYALGSGGGPQDFAFDGLVAGQSLTGRIDFKTGPWTFRYLNKFNIDTRQWYDREYEIALVAREFEPFIAYRQFPSETRIGIRFRIDNLRDRLLKRKQSR